MAKNSGENYLHISKSIHENAKTYVMYTSQQSLFYNLVRSPKIGVVRFPPAVWIYCNLVHFMYKRLSLNIRSSSSIVIFDTLQKEKHKNTKRKSMRFIVFSVIFLFRNTIFFQSLPFIQRVYSENVNLLALSSSIHTLFNQGLVCIILLRIPFLPAIKAL